MRKAAVSIPANIAEGFKKRGKLDKVRFLNIAQGSTEESRCYLLLSNDLGYGDTKSLLPSGRGQSSARRLLKSDSDF
jgi:four helix bundle protein